ncbi:MAG: 3-hydroxyisobutyryl-CoA hydrolase [Curvibacter sp. RIFCSPHIGHO2_12_FULL_63_18]|uniref:enoyl-CoA hydratase/isomerase family protein n=1 Tax=Rhodoferax sp. TaxID=50421 RepID=UPI0008ABAD51|nr:enoyl-CoA hydratase/isomerase family protein [Rhodoferax sp.]OGO96871.1 MAG: 3-hydroxyisobutyryl-CoA hydrolase [Curvibacter sp. GWA2_63_95]OGP01049.1 MAG: 3-hydroxyisobutyryl-CoA hydrolase [Curvibacter sp. RIFCSPHIGHO2_12_FULL_63_18]HCX80627.1 3-hydroxyisobutyryl-CoA hydrolase [Rhodoferax sp.]
MTPMTPNDDVITEFRGQVGLITLNRAKALNALSLGMVRSLTATLQTWKDDAAVKAVAIRGSTKTGVFGGFCAGGDIRFFHQAALAGNPALEDFFTEEYALNHLIHHYPKPYIAFMDGIVMGGGMGISQGASHRLVTEHTKMAMPETNIGLFPDVGGGYFLSRCPGRTGEWLALTGDVIDGPTAVALGLADQWVESARLPEAWEALTALDWTEKAPLDTWVAMFSGAACAESMRVIGQIDHYFGLETVAAIVQALEADGSDWARQTAATLRKRSPLMLHVVLEQVRRARGMTLADDLRMERDLVRHCFYTQHLGRSGAASETVEGIRALAVDKDHAPRWNPACIEEVTTDMVAPFFASPWPTQAHPLRGLV